MNLAAFAPSRTLWSYVKEIGIIKKKNKLPIIDKERENKIIEKLSKLNYKSAQFQDIKNIFEKILSISRIIQDCSYNIAFLFLLGRSNLPNL